MSRRFSRRHSGPPGRRDRVPARTERPDIRGQIPATPAEPEPDLGPTLLAEATTAGTPEEVKPAAPLAPEAHAPIPAAPTIEGPRTEEETEPSLFPDGSCTAAQLRRFIKSRPYVPMHELRRRFELNGGADEVTPIATATGTVFLGLPDRESQFVADLVRLGDVGLEICRDPTAPMVVGVFAMKPISRQ